MSRVWSQIMDDIAKASECDWDFVVDMYNYIWDKHGDVELKRFANGIAQRNWSVRENGRFKNVLMNLSDRSGYTYDHLFSILADMIYDSDDGTTMDEFIAITLERDW